MKSTASEPGLTKADYKVTANCQIFYQIELPTREMKKSKSSFPETVLRSSKSEYGITAHRQSVYIVISMIKSYSNIFWPGPSKHVN